MKVKGCLSNTNKPLNSDHIQNKKRKSLYLSICNWLSRWRSNWWIIRMLEDSIVYFRFLLGLLNLPLEIISKDVYNYGHYHTLTITWLTARAQDT